MIVAHQAGQALILGFALLYRDVRVLQAVWAIAIVREAIDLWARLDAGGGLSPVVIAVLLGLEVAAFVQLGRMASWRVGQYATSSDPVRLGPSAGERQQR
jgi:hypothetical protein